MNGTNKELEKVKNSKLKAFGKQAGRFIDAVMPAIIVIFVVLIILAAVWHFVLLLRMAPTTYVDDLDYCEVTYGLGWIQDYDVGIDYYCYFIEEDGFKQLRQMNKGNRESRVCERQFYHPNYCG